MVNEILFAIWHGVFAHVGGLSDAAAEASVPGWLTVMTGGVLVGGSFLFTSLLTDHEGIRAVNGSRLHVPAPDRLRQWLHTLVGLTGIVVVGVVILTGLTGPSEPTQNFAILTVWVGWWAGFAMSTYLIGNTWPAANPWRTIADALPIEPSRSLPERWGVWPSVVGLLGLIWIEVVSPLAADPRALAWLVVLYTVVTLIGATLYGTDTWFGRVDPIARVFALYGRVAPIQFTDDGIEIRLHGTALTEGQPSGDAGAVAFVVALLWATTFDGLVTTPIWNDIAGSLIGGLGFTGMLQQILVPSVYLLGLVSGFIVFLGAYRVASAYARRSARSYLTPETIGRWLVPSLLPIAAGYHIAHSLGYFISLAPAVAAVAGDLLGLGLTPQVAILPAWFGTLQLGFVVLGHLLAVWVAHALAMELFPGILNPIRSQYPYVIVMMVYTMTSAYVIGQPFVEPVYL
jgi:hypothetical protein